MRSLEQPNSQRPVVALGGGAEGPGGAELCLMGTEFQFGKVSRGAGRMTACVHVCQSLRWPPASRKGCSGHRGERHWARLPRPRRTRSSSEVNRLQRCPGLWTGSSWLPVRPILPNQLWHCLYLPGHPATKLGWPPSSSLPAPRQPGSPQAELLLTLRAVLMLSSRHCQGTSSKSDAAAPCTEKLLCLRVHVNNTETAPTVSHSPRGP